MQNDEQIRINGLELGKSLSQSIFNRKGNIKQVEVFLDRKILVE
jgi:hypothetical protein